MRRLLVAGFYLASALLIVALLAMGLELFARAKIRLDKVSVSQKGADKLSAAVNEDDHIIQQIPDPTGGAITPPDSTWESVFATNDPARRAALAEERAIWLALLDRDGNLVESYPPGEGQTDHYAIHKELTKAIASLPKGVNASAFMAADALDEFQQALAAAFDGKTELPRYLPANISSEVSYDAEWLFGLPITQDGSPLVPLRVAHRTMEKRGYQFRANIDVPTYLENWPNSRLKTNSLGWRDDEVAIPKPPGVFRIVCVGGSTTVAGPRNDLTYPNMVEKLLRERLGTDKIEVVNCGIYAATARLMVQRMDDYLLLEPDLFIQYDFVNDFLRGHRDWIRESPKGLWFNLFEDSEFFRYYLNPWFQPSDDVLRAGYCKDFFQNFDKTIAEAKKIGAHAAFASFAYPDPDYMQEPWEANWFLLNRFAVWHCALDSAGYAEAAALFNRELKKYCDETGALYIPVAEHVQGGVESFTDMCHMRLTALQKMALTVADAVQPLVEKELSISK